MHYSNRECDVSPYRDDYAPIKNVPIVQAATAYQSVYTGQIYILIFNEALWMGDQLDHTLINPNQLRHHGIKVQDNPTSDEPLYIMTENSDFNMELKMKGTVIFAETFTPSEKELHNCPHVVMSSPHEWNPHTVQFQSQARLFEDEMTQRYKISSTNLTEFKNLHDDENLIFNIGDFNNRLINSVKTTNYSQISSLTTNANTLSATKNKERLKAKKAENVTFVDTPLSQKTIDIGNADSKMPSVFQSTKRHTDVSAEDLSKRWFINL